jgi:antitoxin component of MazEF toxin-antitoxin module
MNNTKNRKKHSPRYKKIREVKKVVTSKIRQIGNSKGIILSKELMDSAGISENADILIQAHNGSISIIESKINTNLSSWDKQFKKAIKDGKIPEQDLFEGFENKFDQEEWK